MPRRSAALALIAGALCVSVLAPGRAQQQRADAQLTEALGALVAASGLGEGVGVSVVDASTGRAIYASRADAPLNPASNMKLITAATALLELGTDFTMPTALHGRIEAGAVVGGLYLRGGADPGLRMADLVELAHGLADRGVRRVDEVVVDGSYFDERVLPPAFEQQPSEVAPFRAAIAAVSVDENAYELRIVPAQAEGQPAEVRLDAAGYFVVDNQITTGPAGSAPQIIADQRVQDRQLSLRLRGTIPLGILGVSYRRRVEDPLAFAGHMLVEALRRANIRSGARVRFSTVPPEAGLLVARRSQPLGQLVWALGKESDNFVAEMLLKTVGAEKRGRPGHTASGAEVALAVLGRAGVPRGGATIVNGSGLFDGNRVAPAHFTRLLAYVYRNPSIRSEYLAHLAIAGRDGTLENRLTDLPARDVVRAKTGTLDDVVALSGYVLGPDASRALAFSVLTNGVHGRHAEARALTDGVVRALVAHLHGAPAATAGSQ